ncbi:HNH endonuclease signature motif containing protein [Cupriavidus campinensis]|uniref:HNH endonuclease n=1 Tax=Cupriavidus campinensis TaxID=151783 RepID=A0ABY3EKJ1_9BURK|nr:HNH endonuclease signature motif containing protein [Cupriavidus campinensis]TSP11461.1 HNH endonuclease [Cupriavidus campinensis]
MQEQKRATPPKGSILATESAPKTRVSGKNPVPASARIRALVIVKNGCWEWVGSKDRKGYGRMWVRGRGNTPAHRASYEIHKGPIPDGFCVLHACDNPQCVNPDHLSLGSLADNNADMRRKGRHAHAETSGHAKITAAIAAHIRAEYKPYINTYRALGQQYGIAMETVRDIIKGYTWNN